jgi:predicted DsbA family dithiol-disulfide isomerase/cytochrome c-type biogenesis protein CcmH/NrfF
VGNSRDVFEARCRPLVLSFALFCACASSGPRETTTDISLPDGRRAEQLLAAAEIGEDVPLDAEGHAQLLRVADQLDCPCRDQRATLSTCALGRTCLRAPFALRQLVRGTVQGQSDTQIVTGLLQRFGPREREPIDLEHAACRGPDQAPVTLVVFSDFECPACAGGRKLIEVVERQSRVSLRICYKHFPLQQHPHARLAARAAIAAQKQGRFWRYHDLLFDDQWNLDESDLVERAEQIGLDIDRFVSDLHAPEGSARLDRDLREALRLRVRATPTFFINGRPLTGSYQPAEILDWVAEEVALVRASARADDATDGVIGADTGTR